MAKDGMKKLNPGLRKYLVEKKKKADKKEKFKVGVPKDRSKKM
jgi:hypothetical protein